MSEQSTPPNNSSNTSQYDEYRLRVAGTTIDDRTLLSTDYFNSFNEIVMLLGMIADSPEIFEEIRAWRFRDYKNHFHESRLSFRYLAIEAYPHAPPHIRQQFENLVDELHHVINEACLNLRPAENDDELCRLKLKSAYYTRCLHDLIEKGSSIVHGAHASINQNEINKMF